ncbi:putative metal-binding motif-containing protein [Candidatus Pacearchaeota archaeon]|nr:putative metal-binding motif-containing protein [Candidatus Pacearchaeota archaeon]
MRKGVGSKVFSSKNSSLKIIFAVSIVLILSISIVSAGFLDGLLRVLGIPITGNAASGNSCTDSDGYNNFNAAGYTTVDAGTWYDYCESNTAWDYNCVYGGDTGPSPTYVIAPLITGRVIGPEGGPDRTYKNCADIGLTCIGGGICGCSPEGSTKSCATGINSPTKPTCSTGTMTCSGGSYGSCIAPSTAETCNGIDDNCNGQVDDGSNLCPSGKICSNGQCVASSPPCSDVDGDKYVAEAPTSSCIPPNGFLGYNDCNDANANINPGKTENLSTGNTCTDGLDNDCDNHTDSDDTGCQQQNLCGNGVINTGEQCDGSNLNSKTCVTQGFASGTLSCTSSCTFNTAGCITTPSCTDTDGDKYVKESQSSGCSTSGILGFKGYNDCNDNEILTNPGVSEQCGDGVDNDCNSATSDICPSACASCTVNQVCYNNACCNPNPVSVTCGIKNCGTAVTNCNETIACGTLNGDCQSGQTCNANGQCAANPVACTDIDGDGYVKESSSSTCTTPSNFLGYSDNNDSDNKVHPGATEICDGKDNDQNGQIDEGLVEVISCPSSSGLCNQKQAGCVNGTEITTCAGLGLTNPSANETANSQGKVIRDGIDNNCDGQIDEGAECNTGEIQACDTSDVCKTGAQKCVQGIFSSTCDVVNTTANCNVATDCNLGDIKVCGTNAGECYTGYEECGSDRKWGECSDKKPGTEICDNLDNNCDGQIDEGLNCNNQIGTENNQTNQTGRQGNTNNQQNNNAAGSGSTTESESFFSKLLKFLATIFKVGQLLIGTGQVTNQAPLHCSDSDGGSVYVVKGVGNGLDANDKELWFQDKCYKGSISNEVDKCSGEGCFLLEYSCEKDQKHFAPELNVKCDFGCSKGACIPTREQSDACQPYFDEKTFSTVYPCQ